MASKRTVQFEFEVDADTRQLDRFRDSLQKLNNIAPVSEGVLRELRLELLQFASANAKTENSMQGQIAALRDASKNADLTGREYGRLRAEMRKLGAEYERLTALESDMLKGQATVLRSENYYEEKIAFLKKEASSVDVTTKAYADLQAQIALTQKQYAALTGRGDKPAVPSSVAVVGDGGLTGQATGLGSSAEYQQRIAFLEKQAKNVAINSREYGTLQERIRSLTGEYKRLQSVESSALKGQVTVLGS